MFHLLDRAEHFLGRIRRALIAARLQRAINVLRVVPLAAVDVKPCQRLLITLIARAKLDGVRFGVDRDLDLVLPPSRIRQQVPGVGKVGVEVLFTPVTYKVVGFLKRAEQEDYYDRQTDFNPFTLRG